MSSPKKAKKKISKNWAIQELIKCHDDPIYFIENYCYIRTVEHGKILFKLFEYQKESIRAYLAYDRTIINKPRQMGYSTLTAAFVSWYVFFHNDKSVLFLANKQDVAKGLLKKVKLILAELPDWMLLSDLIVNQAHSLEFSNGSSIKAVGTSEDAGRGESLSLLIIDEAAIIRNFDEIWKAIKSTVSTGGKIIAGSCVTKDTMVLTKDGVSAIEDFIEENQNIGFSKVKNYKVRGVDKFRESNDFYYNGLKDTLKIQTKYSELECTTNHKLWSYVNGDYGWHEASELSVGDWVNVSYGMEIWGNNDDVSDFKPTISNNIKNKFDPKKIDANIAYLLGLFLAEGSTYIKKTISNDGIRSGNITITCGDDISSFIEACGFKFSKSDEVHYTISCKNFVEFLQYLGFDLSKKAHEKEIPSRLLKMSRGNISALLSGMFDGDGSAHATKGEVSFVSSSEKMINQVRFLLLNFGILASKTKMDKEKLNKSLPDGWHSFNYDSFALRACASSSKVFYDKIGFKLPRKQKVSSAVDKNEKLKFCGGFPGGTALIKRMNEEIPLSSYKIRYKFKVRPLDSGMEPSQSKFEQHLEMYKNNGLSKELSDFIEQKVLIKNGVWVKIKKIEKSKNETYDFSLPADENDFWCHSVLYNGILGHQTPKGASGWFYDTCSKAEAGENEWKYLLFNWWDNPDYAGEDLERSPETPGGWTSTWFRKETKDMTIQHIRQELLTSFLDSGDTFLDISVIHKIQAEATDPKLKPTGFDDALWVWQPPQKGKKYIVSCDVASGGAGGEDYCTAQILELKELEQVAEYKARITPDILAENSIEICKLYNNAHLVIENNGIGLAANLVAKRLGYKNLAFFAKETGRLIDKWTADYQSINPGFAVTPKSRPVILAKLQEFLNKNYIKINSKRFANELLTFVVSNGKPQASKGKNDDLIMAMALAVWVRDICPDFGVDNSTIDLAKLYSYITVNTTNLSSVTLSDEAKAEEKRSKIRETMEKEMYRDMPGGNKVDLSWIYKS